MEEKNKIVELYIEDKIKELESMSMYVPNENKENGAKENSTNQQHLLVCYNSNLSGNQFLYECMAQNLDRLAVCRSPVCGCDRNRTDRER